MTNQEQYEIIWDKANKYDKLIKALDKIRTEMHATVEMHEDGYYYLHEEWIDEIIDKYKESEE
jgi:hypothetical protein